jgi:hypothetical protein
MIHYLYAFSPTLNKELSQFEFHGMLGGEHVLDTTEQESQINANEFASMLNESAHLTATDWVGRISTAKPE